ncbi:MAG: hypothetical protein AB8B48_22160 [Pseudomonadales bacterium]
MRIFYATLLVVYSTWFVWYGGSGDPVTDQELETYVSAMTERSQSGHETVAETTELMQRLGEFDTGNEFLMVNLIKYRDRAAYPKDSVWAEDADALAADSRYSSGVVKELLWRGSLPILKSSVIGTFIIDDDWRDWDVVAIVRYRSVKDMLDMIVGMADSGLAVHKFASIKQTHVFPVEPEISLFSLRTLVALLLLSLALIVRLLVKRS